MSGKAAQGFLASKRGGWLCILRQCNAIHAASHFSHKNYFVILLPCHGAVDALVNATYYKVVTHQGFMTRKALRHGPLSICRTSPVPNQTLPALDTVQKTLGKQ